MDSLFADQRQRETKSIRRAVGEDGKGGHVKPIRQAFGYTRAVTITPDRVRASIAGRQKPCRGADGQEKPGISNAKINRELQILGR